MKFFRSHSNPVRLPWIVLLSITLLFTQNLKLHIHSLDHGPAGHHDDGPAMLDSHHEHIAVAHLSIDTSHADHHDVVMHEMDASPDSLVHKPPSGAASTDLLVLFILLSILGACILYKPGMRRAFEFPPDPRFHLTPLLRAPPC